MNEEKHEEDIQFTQTELERPKVNIKDLILSLVAVLLCGCTLSGAIPAAYIGLASAAMFVYVVIAIRNIGAVLQLLLTSVLVTALTFLPVCGAAVLALMLGAGTLAWLFMTLPKYKWAPIGLLAVSYGLGCLVTSDFVIPLLALAFLPAAALMAWAHARDLGRTSTVLHAFLGFIFAALAALCVLLFKNYGSVNYNVLMTFVNQLKDLFVTIAAEGGKILLVAVEEAAAEAALPADAVETLRQTFAQAFAESNLRIMADTLMGLAPALIGVPALIISYLSNVVLLRKYYNTEWRSHMTLAACTLTVSPAASVIYFVCMLIVVVVSKQSVFLMAVTNMCLLLLPGLALVGINVILHNARRTGGWLGKASILLVVAVVFCMGLSSLYFLALWGAYVTISAALHKKIMQKLKDQNKKDQN
ncbi:MAG: hypothetical protein E7659_02975 [Ruminococcaceae bacterium]|nr:hypothetical protein [Oscillospiraceae bacterium]